MKHQLISKITSVLACCSLFVLVSTANALDIQYTATGANQTQLDAFEMAVQRWENTFTTDVVVSLDFRFESMGSGTIGSTSTAVYYARFNDVRGQLNLLGDSAADTAAVNYLNAIPMNGNNYQWYSNGTDGVDYDFGSTWNDSDPGTPTDNPWNILATSANLKAIGYTGFTNNDATIRFNTDFAFDYNPYDGNGVGAGTMDFVGVATHEIGHALGFVSSVDDNAGLDLATLILDIQNGGRNNNVSAPPTLPPSILDIYRHSDVYGANTIDISYDGRDAYFSHDGGLTQIAFSTGPNGDGRQTSHWKDNLGLGLMDPTAAYGEFLQIGSNDLLAFDTMGWNVVPEPSTMLLLGTGLLALAGKRNKVEEDFSA